jgi:adenylate kinase family enzyme
LQRVLVLGPPGAGKSTFAREIARRLALPVIHLDASFWQPGWKETPRDLWRDRVKALASRDAWVMDGNYASTLPERVAVADTAILLLLPLPQCIYRMFKRGLWERGHERPDLNPGCPEQVPSWDFVRYAASFRKSELPAIMAHLRPRDRAMLLITLRSSSAVLRYLDGIPDKSVSRPAHSNFA